MNPGIQLLGDRLENFNNTGSRERNMNRYLERNLLLLAGVYLLAGTLVLYLGLESATSQVLIAGVVVTLAFFLVHFYCRLLPSSRQPGWFFCSGWTLPTDCGSLSGS